jgi:hypothetical protein
MHILNVITENVFTLSFCVQFVINLKKLVKLTSVLDCNYTLCITIIHLKILSCYNHLFIPLQAEQARRFKFYPIRSLPPLC